MSDPIKRFYIKQGDQLPALELAVVRESTGAAYDLSGHSSPKFSMRKDGARTSKISNATATIAAPATAGIIRYDWASGDTDTPGVYRGEFSAINPTSLPVTFPNDDYIEIHVVQSLD